MKVLFLQISIIAHLFGTFVQVSPWKSLKEYKKELLLNAYESDYEALLLKSNKSTLQIRRIKLLAIEILKTINDLNPPYMKEIFELNTRRDTGSKRLVVQSQNSMKYGSYTIRSLGPRIWNKLNFETRDCNTLSTFKELIKTGRAHNVTAVAANT